jgi:hypothetical protein
MSAHKKPQQFDVGLCSVCGKTAESKCSRCLVVRYCGKPCQRTNWASHKVACAELRDNSLLQLEHLVFDVSAQPPRALVRLGGRGEPVELTAAQLKAPLGRFPYGQQGGSTPPEAVVGKLSIGTSVELGKLEPDESGKLVYGPGPALLGVGRRLKLLSSHTRTDSMFSITVTVEEWEKAGGALWLVEDAIAIVLERFRVKHEPSSAGFVWGSDHVKGFWAVSVEKDSAPGRFSLCPHLFYHFTVDVNHAYGSCVVA